jgi:hypothetical protein
VAEAVDAFAAYQPEENLPDPVAAVQAPGADSWIGTASRIDRTTPVQQAPRSLMRIDGLVCGGVRK